MSNKKIQHNTLEKYDIDKEEFFRLFYMGISQRDIAQYFGIRIDIIRAIGKELNLDWKKRTFTKKISALDTSIRDIERLKYKYSLLNTKYKKLSYKYVVDSEWVDKLVEYINKHTNFFPSLSKHFKNVSPQGSTYAKHVLLLSDWHIGNKVDDAQVHNTYDLTTASKRVNLLLSSIEKYKSISNSNTIYIFLLGDFIESGIHDDILSDESNIYEYLFWTFDKVLYICKTLQEFGYEKINMRAVVGNHGRLRRTKYYKNKFVSLDAFLYGFLKRKFVDFKNITFTFNKENIGIVAVNNHLIGYLHGDILNGFSDHTIDVLQSQIKQMFGYSADSIVMGHFHSPKIIYNSWGGVNIVNGSLIGVDEFAAFNNLRLKQYSQYIFTIDDKPNNFFELL